MERVVTVWEGIAEHTANWTRHGHLPKGWYESIYNYGILVSSLTCPQDLCVRYFEYMYRGGGAYTAGPALAGPTK